MIVVILDNIFGKGYNTPPTFSIVQMTIQLSY